MVERTRVASVKIKKKEKRKKGEKRTCLETIKRNGRIDFHIGEKYRELGQDESSMMEGRKKRKDRAT